MTTLTTEESPFGLSLPEDTSPAKSFTKARGTGRAATGVLFTAREVSQAAKAGHVLVDTTTDDLLDAARNAAPLVKTGVKATTGSGDANAYASRVTIRVWGSQYVRELLSAKIEELIPVLTMAGITCRGGQPFNNGLLRHDISGFLEVTNDLRFWSRMCSRLYNHSAQDALYQAVYVAPKAVKDEAKHEARRQEARAAAQARVDEYVKQARDVDGLIRTVDHHGWTPSSMAVVVAACEGVTAEESRRLLTETALQTRASLEPSILEECERMNALTPYEFLNKYDRWFNNPSQG